MIPEYILNPRKVIWNGEIVWKWEKNWEWEDVDSWIPVVLAPDRDQTWVEWFKSVHRLAVIGDPLPRYGFLVRPELLPSILQELEFGSDQGRPTWSGIPIRVTRPGR